MFCCPDCQARYEALVIAPTLLKTYRNGLLAMMWRRAEDQIAKADEVMFLGYSMPDADVHLRCMFTRALFTNRTRRKKTNPDADYPIVTVVQRPPETGDERIPPRNNDVRKRYERLFGHINYDDSGLERFIDQRFSDS